MDGEIIAWLAKLRSHTEISTKETLYSLFKADFPEDKTSANVLYKLLIEMRKLSDKVTYRALPKNRPQTNHY